MTVESTRASPQLEEELPVGFCWPFVPGQDTAEASQSAQITLKARHGMGRVSFSERSVDVVKCSNDACSQAVRTMLHRRRLKRHRHRVATATKPTRNKLINRDKTHSQKICVNSYKINTLLVTVASAASNVGYCYRRCTQHDLIVCWSSHEPCKNDWINRDVTCDFDSGNHVLDEYMNMNIF